MKRGFKKCFNKENLSLIVSIIVGVIVLFAVVSSTEYNNDKSSSTTNNYIFSSNGKQIEISVKSIRCSREGSFAIYNLEDGSTIVARESMVVWEHEDSVDVYSDFSITAKSNVEEGE